jgi:phospholipid/cholesterol/gamma-HCH transport system substrate-binding protein
METRARYVVIGLFTLAVSVAGFLFVYWLQNVGGLRRQAIYQVRFESPVSGLLKGSAVHFNGIRVGEVTDLRLSAEDPRQVMVTAAIDPTTPVRADTLVEVEFQGLTGATVISLRGGSAAAPPLSGQPPLLVADQVATQSLTQAAREALRRLDATLAENTEPLKSTLGNLNTFSAALARNSDKLDGIVAGLERMTGGGTKAPVTTYGSRLWRRWRARRWRFPSPAPRLRSTRRRSSPGRPARRLRASPTCNGAIRFPSSCRRRSSRRSTTPAIWARSAGPWKASPPTIS